MAVSSKNEICKMAQAHLGNFGSSVNDIDNPQTNQEITFALWYDTARQDLLKTVIPNFSMTRRTVGQKSSTPTFGYAYAYEYPADCLKLLGVGDVDLKANDYSVEAVDNEKSICLDDDYTTRGGLPIRFIRDVENVDEMDADFIALLAVKLAAMVCMPLTQDFNKKKLMEQMLTSEMSRISGMNAQENRPVRKSNSRYKQARWGALQPSYVNKR